MLSITNGGSLARALSAPIDPRLKALLLLRRDQLGGDLTGEARFVLVQPGDALPAVREALGFDPLENPIDGTRLGDPDFTPAAEWGQDHGFALEIVWIFTDDFAHVLLVEKAAGVAPELIHLCEAFAPAGGVSG